MRNIFQKKSKKKSRPKSAPKKITKNMRLTDLQNVAKKNGIRFAGLTKNELYKELVNYGVVHT